ncbi:MAG: helix-turn-helix transcriptional regulator [Pyrinomonadaceae bacterium]
MTGRDLKLARKQRGWSQEQAAHKLGVSQPYLSLLEGGRRRVTDRLAQRAVKVYGLPADLLPVKLKLEKVCPPAPDSLAADLAALGYPGFSYLRPRRKKNPVEVLLSALSAPDLESRLTEALPWVLLEYPRLDWETLTKVAKANDLQNKLGMVTSVARKLAERRGEHDKARLLTEKEATLGRSRLLSQGTLCHESLTGVERRWLQSHRPAGARHWRLLTDLSPEHLSHAA